MPPLNNRASHEFWKSYPDKIIYKVVTFMESAESSMMDGLPQVEEAMKKLGDVLENLGRVDLQKEDDFVDVLAYLHMARMLYILQRLDIAFPGAAAKILTRAEKNTISGEDAAGILLKRNVEFERLRMLSRIFSNERLDMVMFEEDN